jgi:hypothetical protein
MATPTMMNKTISLQYAHADVQQQRPALKHAVTAPPGPTLTRARSAASVKRVMTSDGTEVKVSSPPRSRYAARIGTDPAFAAHQFKPSFGDVSPLNNIQTVLRQPHNLISLIYSGVSSSARMLQAGTQL